VRNTGIAVAAISAAIIKTPGMPQVVIDIASFLVAIGGTMGVISQATVKREA
jgi:flagellar motor component MotA